MGHCYPSVLLPYLVFVGLPLISCPKIQSRQPTLQFKWRDEEIYSHFFRKTEGVVICCKNRQIFRRFKRTFKFSRWFVGKTGNFLHNLIKCIQSIYLFFGQKYQTCDLTFGSTLVYKKFSLMIGEKCSLGKTCLLDGSQVLSRYHWRNIRKQFSPIFFK